MYIHSFIKGTMNLFNDGAGYIDTLFMPNDNKGIRCSPLFIIGLPRSGTTLTYQVVLRYFNAAYFNHLMDYFYGLPHAISRMSRRPDISPEYSYTSRLGHIEGIFSPSETAGFWFYNLNHAPFNSHKIDSKICNTKYAHNLQRIIMNITCIQEKQYVFKCVYLALNIELLNKLFPSARFLIVERDPFTVCKSLYTARKNRTNPNIWWSIKPPGYEHYCNNSIYEQIAFQVSESLRHIENGLNSIENDKYIRISYERFCASPLSILKQLQNWLEPLGYEVNENPRIPDGFTVSQGPELNDEENRNLMTAWRKLGI